MRLVRGRYVLFFVVALLSAWTGPRMLRAAEDPPITCTELGGLGLAISLSDKDLTDGDGTGFCLVARPEEDTFVAYLPNVFTTEAFRAQKARYAAAMTAKNYDVCRVGAWRVVNREGTAAVPLATADRLDLPSACAPRVVARDQGAAASTDQVGSILTTIARRTQSDFTFEPRRPLTVDLYSDADAFTAALRTARPDLEPEAAERLVQEGRSLTVLSPTRGAFILLNVRSSQPETLRRRIAHEYTHFVQSAAAGTLDAYPLWFLEGQAELQMERLAGLDWDRRGDATRRQSNGTAPHLADLITEFDWSDTEARLGNGVYSRAYAAVAYIAERWGYAATVRLLKAGSETEPERFAREFADITGMDLDTFNKRLSEWLRGTSGAVTFVNDSPLALLLMRADGSTISLPACTNCTFQRQPSTCITDGRPAVTVELEAGEYVINRVVPDDRIHFPDSRLTVQIEAGATLTRCLNLVVR